MDNPDIEVNVAHNKDFVSLRPGESWITTFSLDNEIWEFPKDLQPGDVFRVAFKGATVEWWDWGSKDQVHTRTVVTINPNDLGTDL
jgi:hypothetical protein